MEKISLVDRVKDKLLHRVKEDRNVHIIQQSV